MEIDLWQHYKTANPGQVQVLGADVLDGSIAQLSSFKTQTGVTYPLMRNCYISPVNAECFVRFYGDRDHFAVIDQAGFVRYNSALTWPYGAGYQLNEIRSCVDTLVNQPVGVEAALPRGFALATSPNPARSRLTIMLASPRDLERSRVTVLDLSGRRVATLCDGPMRAGQRELIWDVRDDSGSRVAPGLYLVLAEVGEERLARRLVVVR